ncbi:sushi, von Willebrand factor type A, EGF and pentraxin domain-containing protein 1 isoform X2 [Vanessa atalanta]|uniref:sushi, von Willebrand factor type A, EGF and pentraxin domain-containing protein 1 isoform X2 n=1 Tax=Vanessa atalanta TaxID=42275 RepID=UPI001FCE27E3|nr:sushi, von Willebrand factor type A, EGF and pentraxin domain-containing protein 1 isoform X2 [Vanessa atalanta]
MDVIYFSAIFALMQGYVAASCRFPGAPAHSRVTFSDENLTEGTVATYACERGFELLGPSRRLCDTNGKWTPDGIPFCVLNVAAGKAPMQISTEEGGVPQRALDGSTSAAFNAETCTLTKSERVPWWYVNLLEPYMVQLVRLDFGKPCCGVNKPAVVVVRVGNNRPDLGTNPVCNRFTGFLEEGQPLFLPCNPPMPGAFVSVHLESSSPSQLSICEAFVYTDQALPIERCPQFRDQPPGSTATYNGKCYIFYDRQPANFRDSLAFCRSRGGTLVDESNPALQGFISWELWRRHRSDSSSQYWMGAVRDPQDPNNWKWVNGNDVTVSFWNAPGGSEGCARFDGSKGWLWADTECQSRLNYICQHQPKACGRPEQPPNSTMTTESFEVGATVEYACDEGHLLVGPTVRTCLDTGFYDEFPPVCKRIECGFPADIAHGAYELINGSVSYLSHVQYACESGYEMVGRSRLVCDIDERWNGPPPHCDVVQCEDAPQIQNGQVSVSNNASVFGAIAEYTCLKGYKLHGTRRISCLATGSWDKPAPHCNPEERMTTSTTTTTTTTTSTLPPSNPPPTPTTLSPTTAPVPTTPRLVLPTRPRTQRPLSSPNPFVTPEPTRRLRPRITTTERTTTKAYEKSPPRKVTVADSQDSPTSHVPHIIVASHPRENQIFGNGNNIRAEQTPRVNVPLPVDGDRRETLGARLNIGAVVALAAFGALVFLIAIITTIVILVKRKHNDGKRYRHHVSPDCNTVASLDSSSSESRSGLNRYYRQAWEELHEATGAKHGHRRHEREAPKDGSELVVSDVYPAPHNRDKRRHHHHHHHREPRHPDWQPSHRPHHNHKPRY